MIFLLFRLTSLIILVIPTGIGLMLGQAFGRLCFYILRKERVEPDIIIDVFEGKDPVGLVKTD